MNADMDAVVHPMAVVERGAIVGPGCQIGPFSNIGPDVSLLENVVVGSHVVIGGRTEIGSGTVIQAFASIGQPPQNIRHRGDSTRLVIGERNSIHEYVTMHVGTVDGGGITRIGNDGMFMVGAHVAHDCIVGDHVVMVNYSSVGGHCVVGNHVTIGAHAGIHQRLRIGNGAIVGGLAAVVRDVIPFGTVYGDRASLHGLNFKGLERQGFARDDRNRLYAAFKSVFDPNGIIQEGAKSVLEQDGDHPLVRELAEFVLTSKVRGLCTPDHSDPTGRFRAGGEPD